MKLITTSLFATFLATLALASDSPTQIEEGIPGYKTVPITWEVQPTLDGPPVLLNGTVREVHAQLLAINPDYDAQVAPVLAAAVTAVTTSDKRNSDNSPLISKRDSITCGVWPSASRRRIEEGIRYLRFDVGGRPGNGPGPGNCGRVSCSYNAAIWWCNENRVPYQLQGFWQIGDGAQAVVNGCASGQASQVSGQRFHGGNWNVIVRGDSC
ncbi:hypothetical protein QBC44DRAFT_404269 [Cladorrhinum sp. PSN332]|nr:hypothetical protein QBC44DRAFT_404269 [Cladorrhinum sp. PSN332]